MTQQAEGLVAGIRGVEWDAVELPSQFMENWCYNRATLNTFGRHYETNEPLPEDLYKKLVAARTFRHARILLCLCLLSVRKKQGRKERKQERQKQRKKKRKTDRKTRKRSSFLPLLSHSCMLPPSTTTPSFCLLLSVSSWSFLFLFSFVAIACMLPCMCMCTAELDASRLLACQPHSSCRGRTAKSSNTP